MKLRIVLVRRIGAALLLVAVMLCSSARGQAQVTVGAAVNGASFVNSALPNGKLAQGVLFTAFGTGMGPTAIVKADPFPLLTTLGGTSVTVTVGTTTVNCPMIFSLATQVAAILPNNTPIGVGTLRVTFNNVTSAPLNITVVAHSFGIFAVNQGGSGPGVLTDPATNIANGVNTAGNPDQILDIWGTGIGIPAGGANVNESTGPAPGDIAGLNMQAFVGTQSAQILYKGRSGCCSGVDQIRIKVPAGISGCFVPVSVTVEGVQSNTTTMSIAAAGSKCSDPVKINEVESSGGVPGDWVELYNPGSAPVDISGWRFLDNDDTHAPYILPAGSTIAAGGYRMLEEADFVFGLGGADSARVFNATGTLVDSFTWTVAADTTYGRCPNGTGAFTTTTSVTKNAANDCSIPAVTTLHINEVESNGGTPGDWVELINTGASAVNISGFQFLDNDDTHVPYIIPVNTTIAAGGYYMLEEAAFGFGLGAADSARLFDATGAPYESYSWTAHATTTYGRCPNGTGAFTTTTSSTKGAANDCGNPVKINEIESSGGVPGDWVELYNPGGSPVDISGFIFKDNDDTHSCTIPPATTIAAGGYYMLEEAAFNFGLGGADSARLFDKTAAFLDSYTWTVAATTTYGRCPNGSGDFTTTTTSTKGSANACPGDISFLAWPGDPDVQIVDGLNVFGGNLSGLIEEASGNAAPGILWGARNGPGALFRLVWNGTIWTPDTANNWASGKALHYPDGTGNPDSEGVTFATPSSLGGIYVSTERNNDVSGTSRNSILRFDPTAAGTSLTATNEWNLTADLPVVGANLGLEAITWIPDTFLVSKNFFDESKNHSYTPAEYANHGTGLFFVGLEANGMIYAYALDHVGGGFTRIATITSGFIAVMDLQFDRELNNLWAVCDDGCQGRSVVLQIDGTGRFMVVFRFERPTAMPNLNNEGFAMAPLAECVANRRPAYWSDDSETGGHAIRRGTLTCTPF